MKKVLKFLSIILMIILVLVLVWNFAYSKYSESFVAGTSSDVAMPKICFQNENQQNIENLNNGNVSYNFSVKNYDETASSVGFYYKLIFEFSQENAPISLTLYRVNGETEEEVILNENKTENYEEIAAGTEENFYKLVVSYDTTSNVSLESNFEINISLYAVQEEV